MIQHTKRQTPYEQRISELHEKLASPQAFIRELRVPAELLPAITTGRTELIALATPRALTAEECRALYALIGALIDTNAALRDHATAVADGARYIADSMGGVIANARRLEALADWREPLPDPVIP